MVTAVKPFAGAGALALATGALLGWRPLLAAALALAALVAYGLSTVERLNYALFALLFLVPVTVDPGYPLNPVWTVLLVAAAIALLGRVRRLEPDAPALSLGMLAFAVPAVCLCAALLRWSGPKDLVAGLLPLSCYAVVTWHLVAEARRDPGLPERLARAFAWVGVPVAALAVYQRVTGTWPVLDQWATSFAFTSGAGFGRSVGTMGHPIVYGTFCMAGMCAALGTRGRAWQVPFAAGALGLVLSGSRSSWLGMAAALGMWYLAQPRKLTRRGLYLLGAAVVAGGGLVAFGPRPVRSTVAFVASRLTDLGGSSSSATARYRRTSAAWSGIRHSAATVLAGRGPEAHTRFFQQIGIGDGLGQAFDNSYLTLWYDFGVLALLVFVAALALVFLRTRSLTARMLVLAFVVQIWFFDFYLWPAAAATLILATALAAADPVRAADPLPLAGRYRWSAA
ncbi:MAG TPA: O-antigen ligase family protein [Rugosimonospora sp.]|nr:O-antigen ligase family protein [Rugosimonospora sp.]